MAEDDILDGAVGPPDPPSHSTSTTNTDEPNLTPDTSRTSLKKRKRKSKARSSSNPASGNAIDRPATPQPHEGEEKPPPPPPPPPPSPISHGHPDPPRPPLGKIQGKVTVLKDKAEALRFAGKYSNRRDDEPGAAAASILPLFTDGSASHRVNDANDHFCSAAVVHRAHPQSDYWLEHGFALLVTKHSQNAEVFGLGRALRVGKVYIAQHPEMHIHTLYIFTDLMTFLKTLWKIEAGIWDVVDRGFLEEFLALDAELAEAGIHVEYHWVPSHNGVEGNCRADRTAKRHRPDILYPHLFRTLSRVTSRQQKHKARANKEKKRKNDEKESAGNSKKGKKRARLDSQE